MEIHSFSGNMYKHCAWTVTADIIALHPLWESRLIVRPAMVWGVMLNRHWACFQRWRTVNKLHLPKTPHDTLLRRPLLSTGSISKCFIAVFPHKTSCESKSLSLSLSLFQSPRQSWGGASKHLAPCWAFEIHFFRENLFLTLHHASSSCLAVSHYLLTLGLG